MRIKKDFKGYMCVIHIILTICSLLCIIPFLLIIAISFSDETTIANFGYSLWPKVFSVEAYSYIFKDVTIIANAYLVTFFFAVVGTAVSVMVMAMGAYALSIPDFSLKKPITVFLLITMLFGGGLIPTYLVNTQIFHLDNNILIYILNGMVSAYNVFVFKAFFKSIPMSLIESAHLDGATEWQVLYKVVIPLSKPVFATFGFLGLIGRWNNFETSLYYITNPKLYSLQYLLQLILNQASYVEKLMQEMPEIAAGMVIPAETIKFAMCVIAAGPMLIVFPFFQKYFSKGMVVGAVKG